MKLSRCLAAAFTVTLGGCVAASDPPSASDANAHADDSLSGCNGQASPALSPSGDYVLSSFGGPGEGQTMSCGQSCQNGSWFYAASRQRYGCGAHLRVEGNGRCVVVEADDYGPDVCVENAAGAPILDASPLVAQALFDVGSAGWSDHLVVHVTPVDGATPLGACQAGGGPPPAPTEPLPPPPSGCGAIHPNEGLGPNQGAWSCDGRFLFIMQSDGNLVLYQDGAPLWATGTNGSGYAMWMQGDGNLVVYASNGQPVWASNTAGRPGTWLAVQNDGNAVLYDGPPIWATNTCCR